MRVGASEKWVMSKSKAGFYAVTGIVLTVAFVIGKKLGLPLPGFLFLAGPVLFVHSFQVPRSRQERLRKFPARVLDSREEDQDSSPETLYLVTLEREHGQDLDYRVEAKLYRELVHGSVGVATAAGPSLLEFERFDA